MPGQPRRFRDRGEAGRKLAARLARYRDQDPVVLALPRGGVPVADPVAAALDAPLDIVVVRKIGAPDQPELGLGALGDGDDPQALLDAEFIARLGVPRAYLEEEIARQIAEARRRDACYRGGRPRVPVGGRTAIVVDDGIATGGSVRAALRSLRRASPARLVLAVPVAPADTVEAFRGEVDDLVCLETPEPFLAVGYHYEDFTQPDDEQVVSILARARARAGSEPGSRLTDA
jgi:putative phosphoribosyl transferase